MSVYVEKREYYNKELAALIGLNPEATRLKRDIENKLTNMGFEKGEDFSFPKRGYTVILWIPQTPEEKIPYLCKLMNIDNRTDYKNFSIFIYCLLENSDFQCRPWENKALWLKEVYNIDVTRQTLYNWCNKLMKIDNSLIKDKNTYSYWRTINVNGEKIQIELNEEEIKEYKQFNQAFFSNEQNIQLDNKKKSQKWFDEMMSTFGGRIYKCYAYTFGAWQGELLEELIKVTQEYLRD